MFMSVVNINTVIIIPKVFVLINYNYCSLRVLTTIHISQMQSILNRVRGRRIKYNIAIIYAR